MARRIELSSRARRDLDTLPDDRRARVLALLRSLADERPPANLDARPLIGHEPWWRARLGDHRVIYRRLTRDEARLVGAPSGGVLIQRVIDRRELEHVIGRL